MSTPEPDGSEKTEEEEAEVEWPLEADDPDFEPVHPTVIPDAEG